MSAFPELVQLAGAIRALHHQVAYERTWQDDVVGCAECGVGWPCRTIRVLDATLNPDRTSR